MVPGQETNPENVAKVMDKGGLVLNIPIGERSISSLMVRSEAAANFFKDKSVMGK